MQHVDQHGPRQRGPLRRFKNARQALFCETEGLDGNNDRKADHLEAPRCDAEFMASVAATSTTSRASWILCSIVVMTVGMTKVRTGRSRVSLSSERSTTSASIRP